MAYSLYLGREVLREEAVGLEAAAGHDDEDVERRLADRLHSTKCRDGHERTEP